MPARKAGHGSLPSSNPLRGILAEAAHGHTTGYGCEFLPRADGATAAIVAIAGYIVVTADLDPAIVHSKSTCA